MTAAPAKGGPAAPPAQQGATPRPPRGGGLTVTGWLRWGWRTPSDVFDPTFC